MKVSRDVVVIAVTRNSKDVLPAFLRSLPSAMAGVDSWELVVVDNDSEDDTLGTVRRKAPWAGIIQADRNAGYAAAVNAGVASAAPGSEVLVINPDVCLVAGSVRLLLETLELPDTGIAFPTTVDWARGVATVAAT